MPPLRPQTTTRSQGTPIDDDLEAVIVIPYVSPDGGNTWQPQGASGAVGTQKVRDDYQTGEILADQSGANGVLTFTFSAQVQMVVMTSYGAASRGDPFGGTPAAALGIRLDDGVPVYVPVETTVVRVYAPSGATVSIFGLRRA